MTDVAAMDGWFKLHRKITESAIFTDADLLRLWIYCLSKAAYKPTTVIIEKQIIELEPGQFVTGRFSLHADYNAGVSPRKKIKDTTLWSWLKRLESYGNLDIKSYNKYSVVTVVKWEEYQETLTTEPQQTDNRLTTEPQQTDTNKNLKNLKKDKNYKNISSSTGETEFSVMTAYTKSFGQLVMPETIRDYVKKLKQAGQTDEMITELILEAGESSTKPNLRFLQAIGQRWLENGITSREQSRAFKNRNSKPSSINRSGRPEIAIVSNEPTGHAPTEEEYQELIRMAEKMQAAKEGKHEKDTA